MTDKDLPGFPALEGFDAPSGTADIEETDGLDFEQREANAGLAGDFSGQVPTNADDDDDLLGGVNSEHAQQVAKFEGSFPGEDTYAQNENVAPGGTITGSGSPFPRLDTKAHPSPMTKAMLFGSEWREKRDAEIARRAEVSAEKKEATVQKARENIDDFYVSYNNKAEKHRAQTKAEAEQFKNSREDTSAGGTSWERIAKLVDVSGKGNTGGASGSGKERFRELLIDLRKDQEAPGASGI
ncbi:Clathrin light chain [Penicillium sp. IBT 35674x]|nr:Clathrin light chain [Penicillium sp. IBT 35674x]